ncbi:MAG: SAM-dependent methyltransferase, partial [Gammaproteobacteria bacterium]
MNRKPTTVNGYYRLSEPEPYGQSLLRQLQARYFAAKGVEAWAQGEVPHYLTSNPRMANSYAEIILALWRDRQRIAPSDEPLYICELGAGSGRFAYHLLNCLSRLCAQMEVPVRAFRYVLTDVPERTLDFWRTHPRFQPFFEQGVLACACFDVNQSDRLELPEREQAITPGTLVQPLVVVANYLFDSIPQELFYFADGDCHQCRVALFADDDPVTLSEADLFAHMHCDYEYRQLADPPYAEPYLQRLITEYQQSLSEAYVLFPDVGLRCLQRLQALSAAGLLILTADKGSHRLEAVGYRQPPKFVAHGSFSLSVNFHALSATCEQAGGLALFPEQPPNHMNVGCLLQIPEAVRHRETISAYQRHVQEFGPDDFFSITRHARQDTDAMSLRDILAYVRLGLYDAHLFACYLPRLHTLAPECTEMQRATLIEAVDRVWALYFPMGEGRDLAFELAGLLFALDDHARALNYLKRSIPLYGENNTTLINMAICHRQLGREDAAEQLLRQ